MVRSHSISGRAPSRRIAVSALTAAITLAIGHAHSQTVSAQSVTITGRAPIVTIGSITNQTVPGQAPAVGHVLHVAPSATDPDNDAITATNIRWKRGATEVGTGADYATTLDDAGQTLTLEVEATTDPAITDPASQTETSSIAIVANTRPTATPTISGTVAIGSTLDGSPGFADVDNDAEGTHSYQWYRADDANRTGQIAVDGATGTSYAITAADVGKFLVFGVIPRTTTGNPNEGVEAFGVSASALAGSAPEARTASVGGTLQTGNTLSAVFSYFDAENDPEGTHTYQWYRDDGTNQTNIENATGKDYVLTGADQGDHYIGVRITAVSSNAPTDGTPVEVRTASKFLGTAPGVENIQLTGTWAAGQTITATFDFVDAENDAIDEAGMEYAWSISDPITGSPTTIPNSNSKTLVLQPSHAGANRRVWFSVSKAKSLTGTPNEQLRPTSPPGMWQKTRDGVIDGNAPTATPTISGTVAQGELLTGSVGYADAQNDPQGVHTYQWYRAHDSEGTNRTAITDATNSSYTVQAADFDHYLVFEVIPRSSTGTPAAGVPTRKVTDVKVGGSAPEARTASVGGTLQTGNTLSANFSYFDAENDPEGTHTYQWYRDDGTNQTNIENATGQDYVLTGADQGDHYIGVRITPVSAIAPTDGDTVEVRTTTKFIGTAPGVTNVDITGNYTVGATLTGAFEFVDAQNDAIDDDGMEYSWMISDPVSGTPTAIPNSNSKTLVLQPSHAGANRKIWFSVEKARSLTGTPNEQLRPTSPPGMWQKSREGLVSPGPIASNEQITGNLDWGQTLQAEFTYDPNGGPEAGEHLYQWYRGQNADGSGKVAIDGATNASYTQQQTVDEGMYIFVGITPKSIGGGSGTTVIARTDKVLRYRKSGTFTLYGTGSGVTLEIDMQINNRTGNAPTNLQVGLWRGFGNENYVVPTAVLIAPSGQTYPIDSPAGGEAKLTTVDASASTASGTWKVRLTTPVGWGTNRHAPYTHFTLEFTP